MKQVFKILFIFLLFNLHSTVYSQIGAGPTTNCSFPPGIPEICGGGSYPASTSGTATALGASFACPGTSLLTANLHFSFLKLVLQEILTFIWSL